MRRLLALLWGEEAATTVEYAVMLALIIVIASSAIAAVGQANSDSWSDTSGQLSSAMGAGS